MARSRKPRRGRRVRTREAKARSLQGSWRLATNRTSSLTKKQATDIVTNPGACPYCGKAIPWQDISLDHVQPRSKGGQNHPDNIVVTDRTCNLSKGDLTGDEFKALMDFLAPYPEMKSSVLVRLRIAGAKYGRYGRRRR